MAYANDAILYTIVYVHPLFGPNPVVLIDQSFGGTGGGGGGGGVNPFAGVSSGTIDGTNRVFTFAVPSVPVQSEIWLNFPLIVGLGYTLSYVTGTLTITYANAPQPPSGSVAGDALYVQGLY